MEYVINDGRHSCANPECPARVSRWIFACDPHWQVLDVALRNTLWATADLSPYCEERAHAVELAKRQWKRYPIGARF